MKISHNWLKSFIDTTLSPYEISSIFTSIGLEVESLERWESLKGGLKGCVIGKVIHCSKHPNADKLKKTKVDVGSGKILDIVCGAPNVAEGQTVVVATEGTTLYPEGKEITIQRTRIRGEWSEGMICAEDELGLGPSHEGIMVLPGNVPAGTPASEYFQIVSDDVYEIGLTPNRIDAASHLGVARDLAAYLQIKENKPYPLHLPSTSAFKIDNHDEPIQVFIENKEGCFRYAGISLTGITIKESPEWLKNRLKAVGLRPINNVVDVTNYVMYELGQPLHAFDASLIKGKKIIVKTLPRGTSFTTLDGNIHTLDENDLMICDESEGLALAGIFGGLHSGITEKTHRVFLESACFNPVWIRRTARRLGINTDSSFRFERGTDPNMPVIALKRAALLIQELAGGKISSPLIDEYPSPVPHHRISVSYENICRLIGKQIEKPVFHAILAALEIQTEKDTPEEMILQVPPYRVDVTREADVAEEILRIYGYNNIEISSSVNSVLTYEEKPAKDKIINLISDYLCSNGFYEIMNNSLTRSAYYEKNPQYAEHLVYLKNPLSNDLNCLRPTLLFGGLETIRHNTNYKNPDLKLYEFGNRYSKTPSHKSSRLLENYQETLSCALWITGLKETGNWLTPETPSSFYYLKTYVNNVFERLGFKIENFATGESRRHEFSTGITYQINGSTIAEIGQITPSLLKLFDLKNPVFFAEINWDVVMKLVGSNKIQCRELPRFPSVTRDLSMIIDSQVTFVQLKAIAEKTEKKLLKDISLFDVFQSEKLGNNKKSYALRFTLLDENKTLTDEEIDAVMNKLIASYEKEAGAIVRKA